MLIKLLNLKCLSLPKVKQRLPVLKLFKCAITTIVVSLLFSVCAFAYTETQDGLNTIYKWTWDGGLTNVRSQYTTTSTTQLPYLRINAVMFDRTVNQNGSIDLSNSIEFERMNAFTEGENLITIYTQNPYINLNGQINESNVVWLTSSTSAAENNFTTTKDFNFTVSLSTLDYYDSSTDEGQISSYFVDDSRVYLYDNGSVVYTIKPTYLTITPKETVTSGLTFYNYKIEFTLDNVNNDEISFDKITFTFPCATNNKPSHDGVLYYSRYRISISDAQLVTVPSETVQDGWIVTQAGNDDLIAKLGTINTVDSAKLEAQNVINDNFESVVNEYTSINTELPDFDFPEEYYKLPEIAVEPKENLSGYWDIFFGSVGTGYSDFSWFIKQLILLISIIACIGLVISGIPNLFKNRGG